MVVDSNKVFLKFFDDRYRIIHHLLFWLLLTVDYFFWIPDSRHPGDELMHFVYFGIEMAVIYVNLYVFVPFLLLKNRLWQFFTFTVVSILFTEFVEEWIEYTRSGHTYLNIIEKSKGITIFIWNIQDQMLFVYAAIGFKLFKIWIKNQRVIRYLENENLKTELDYLKSQINPHFLFNTLNNIYVQTKLDSKRASQTILKLSELLRYQLYECTKETVLLSKEIDYLKNYLELDRIRKSSSNVAFNVTGEANGITIYPFLFLPFFENAIKHGIDSKNESNITVNFLIEQKRITFTIENTKQEINNQGNPGGLGLTNTKRRLQLLYPGKYNLAIEDKGSLFFVKLILDLN